MIALVFNDRRGQVSAFDHRSTFVGRVVPNRRTTNPDLAFAAFRRRDDLDLLGAERCGYAPTLEGAKHLLVHAYAFHVTVRQRH